MLSAVVDWITVAPATRGRHFFDPTRLAIRWRARERRRTEARRPSVAGSSTRSGSPCAAREATTRAWRSLEFDSACNRVASLR